MSWRLAALALGVLAACQGGERKPDCSGAISAVAQIARSGRGFTAQTKHALISQCAKDWPPEAADCMRLATSDDQLFDCRYKHLTGEQAAAFDRAAQAMAGDGEYDFDAQLATMQRFKGKMCACKNAACAKQVVDEITTWSQQMAQRQRDLPKLGEAQMRRATELGQALSECMTKAMVDP